MLCTVDDLNETFGVENIQSWARRDSSQIGASEAGVERAIAFASELVESYFRGDTLGADNPVVNDWTCRLAAVQLYHGKIGSFDDTVSTYLQAMEDRVFNQMKEFKNHRFSFLTTNGIGFVEPEADL